MNTNENNARMGLTRVRKISRILKVMLLIYLAGLVILMPACFQLLHKTAEGYWTVLNVTYATLAEIPWMIKMFAMLCVGLLAAAYVTSFQLLSLYERGIIFSSRNVRLLRRIGFLSVSYGVLPVLGRMIFMLWKQWVSGTAGGVVTMLSFDAFGLLISPWVIGGIFIVVISQIMAEGCKIQEEQELTV
jgi:hypothetical protein